MWHCNDVLWGLWFGLKFKALTTILLVTWGVKDYYIVLIVVFNNQFDGAHWNRHILQWRRFGSVIDLWNTYSLTFCGLDHHIDNLKVVLIVNQSKKRKNKLQWNKLFTWKIGSFILLLRSLYCQVILLVQNFTV